MKLNNLGNSLIKGGCNGIISSIIINIWIIISFYISIHNIIFYIMWLPLAVITYYMLKNETLKYFFLNCICSIILFLIMELIINKIGIISNISLKLYGDYGISVGDGFGIMIIYIFNILGSLLGFVTSFIVTIINSKKKLEQ